MDEGKFIEYSTTKEAYGVYNKITLVVEESMHVSFDESKCFYPMQAFDEDEVHVESWKSNFLPYK